MARPVQVSIRSNTSAVVGATVGCNVDRRLKHFVTHTGDVVTLDRAWMQRYRCLITGQHVTIRHQVRHADLDSFIGDVDETRDSAAALPVQPTAATVRARGAIPA